MTNKEKALELCKGKFQQAVVLGRESLGGAGRVGKAKQYESQYQKSISNLLARLRAADVEFEIVPGPRGGWYGSYLKIL